MSRISILLSEAKTVRCNRHFPANDLFVPRFQFVNTLTNENISQKLTFWSLRRRLLCVILLGDKLFTSEFCISFSKLSKVPLEDVTRFTSSALNLSWSSASWRTCVKRRNSVPSPDSFAKPSKQLPSGGELLLPGLWVKDVSSSILLRLQYGVLLKSGKGSMFADSSLVFWFWNKVGV